MREYTMSKILSRIINVVFFLSIFFKSEGQTTSYKNSFSLTIPAIINNSTSSERSLWGEDESNHLALSYGLQAKYSREIFLHISFTGVIGYFKSRFMVKKC